MNRKKALLCGKGYVGDFHKKELIGFLFDRLNGVSIESGSKVYSANHMSFLMINIMYGFGLGWYGLFERRRFTTNLSLYINRRFFISSANFTCRWFSIPEKMKHVLLDGSVLSDWYWLMK